MKEKDFLARGFNQLSLDRKFSADKLMDRYHYLKIMVKAPIQKPEISDKKSMKVFARKHLNREDMLDEIHRIELYRSGGWYGYFMGNVFHLEAKTIQKGDHIYQDSGSRTGLKPYFRSSGTAVDDWLLSVAEYFLKQENK